MDIRIEKTKTAIHNTFLELRSKKTIGKNNHQRIMRKGTDQ